MLRVIDKIPLSILVIGALFLGGAPFLPEPHLVEKLRMLIAGDLLEAMDWIDLVMHGFLPALLALRLGRMAMGSSPKPR